MRYSPKALTAFVETISCDSFSAAARRLYKNQSTISTAIAHLEANLSFVLFDRSPRQPTLTEGGKRVLSYVQAILTASERLDEAAISPSGEIEARLTFVLSDTLHPDVLEELMMQFDRKLPHIGFECLIGEGEDVIDLLQKGHAQVGLIEAWEDYPTDMGVARLPVQTWIGLYITAPYPLAAQEKLQWEQLHTWYGLRSNTYLESGTNMAHGPVWSAPNYLLLLSVAVQGFGWCALPCALMEEFAAEKPLVQLKMPGWPEAISIDLLWNEKSPPSVAGS